MGALKERREALENRYAHEETLAFKARARAAKAAGLWAAEHLGVEQDRAALYAQELVAAQVAASGDAVFDRLRADFATSGLPHSETWLRRRLDAFAKDALDQALKDG